MIWNFDPNTATFRIGSSDELNALGLRRSRIVHHPANWMVTDTILTRLVDVPRWGTVELAISVETVADGMTKFSSQLSEPSSDRYTEIPWYDLRDRLAGQAMVGASILVLHGLEVFSQPDVFRAVTTIEMVCPRSLTDGELALLEE